MTGREAQSFVGEVERLRPTATMVLAAAVTVPSLWELATGNLGAVALLVRLALAIPVCAVLVWGATGVVLHYVREQARKLPDAPAPVQTHPDFGR